MNRAESVADSMVAKLFSARRGHGSTLTVVERHLRANQLREIVKMAYEFGFADGAKDEAEKKSK